MEAIWICIVISSYVAISKVNGDIFEDMGFNDDWSYFWNRNSLISTMNQPCSSPGSLGKTQGTCRTIGDCALRGGQSYDRANCNFLQSCCIHQRSCGRISRAKVSSFVNPETGQIPEECVYRVELMNQNICQIRIDINTDLAETGEYPTRLPAGRGDCIYDFISITNANIQKQVPKICGKNTDQHVYVPISSSERSLDIGMYIRNRETQGTLNLPKPSWNLVVTQLECPGRKALVNTGNKTQAAIDAPKIAPNGCLQYFTDVSGEIKSFNFEGLRDYMNNHDYAICFRRPTGSCGVKLTHQSFLLEGSVLCVDDYLYVPEARNPLNADRDPKLCGTIVPAMFPITSHHPGPLYLHFHTDATMMLPSILPATAKFKLTYSTASNCN